MHSVFVTKALVLVVLTGIADSSCTVLWTTSFFTTLLSLLESTGVVYDSSISNLWTFDFKLAKSTFLGNFDVLVPVANFKLDFVV